MGVKYEPPIKIGTLTHSADQNNYETNMQLMLPITVNEMFNRKYCKMDF